MNAVEIIERSENCFIATGDAEQWTATHAALELRFDKLTAQYARNPFDDGYNLTAEIARTERLAKEAYEAIFRADQFGRFTIELFASEVESIRTAIAQTVVIPAGPALLITGEAVNLPFAVIAK